MVVLPQDTRVCAALEHAEQGADAREEQQERETHSSIALLPLMLDQAVQQAVQQPALSAQASASTPGDAFRKVAFPIRLPYPPSLSAFPILLSH